MSDSQGRQGWRAGAVTPPSDTVVVRHIEELERRFPIVKSHRENLGLLGSQVVYAAPGAVAGAVDCHVALVRFSGAIETAFGFTREVMFFYSPYPDLQIRTLKAAQESLGRLPREATPDVVLMWSPDRRAKVKLDDWSSARFMAIPLPPEALNDPVEIVTLLRDYIFTRDLYYETTPVSGDRFFGRRQLLQSLREDVRNRRVAGVFGLRKAGKTSVLTELKETLPTESTLFLLRDLESLPSPPDDPVPDLLADLRLDLLDALRSRGLRSKELSDLSERPSITEFKRAAISILRNIERQGVAVLLALDEIEYLVPAERVDIREGNMPSIAQYLGALRSLVQESGNFTFVLSGLTSALIESGRLYGRPNPLFSWAKTYFLSPFEEAEAAELAESVGHRMGVSLDAGALGALYEATGGHAYLYRHLASAVVRRLPVDRMHRAMHRQDVLWTLRDWRRDVAGNVEEMVSHLQRYYPDEAVLLDLLRHDPADFYELAEDYPAELGHLLRLGLVQAWNEEYSLTPVLELI